MAFLPSNFFASYKQVYADILEERNRQFPGRTYRVVLKNVQGNLSYYTIQCCDRLGNPATQIGSFGIEQHANDVLMMCGFVSRPKKDYLVWYHPDFWGF